MAFWKKLFFGKKPKKTLGSTVIELDNFQALKREKIEKEKQKAYKEAVERARKYNFKKYTGIRQYGGWIFSFNFADRIPVAMQKNPPKALESLKKKVSEDKIFFYADFGNKTFFTYIAGETQLSKEETKVVNGIKHYIMGNNAVYNSMQWQKNMRDFQWREILSKR